MPTPLDVAVSVTNLSTALLNFPLAKALVDVSKETTKWLARERIDENIFNKCRELATSLALYPNEEGTKVQIAVHAADRRIMEHIHSAPINLIVSGSLGRLVGRDPDTSYIVSTLSSLTHYHRPEHVADVLCCMILDKGGHEKELVYRYTHQKAPIKAVFSKIIQSAFINITNAGHQLPELPQEFNKLHGHILDAETFAAIVMAFQRSEDDMIIRTKRHLADLTTWFYFHFHGKLILSVSGTIIFEKQLGPDQRNIHIIVDQNCDDQTSCSKEVTEVKASLSSGATLRTCVSSSTDETTRPRSFARKPLYDVDDLLYGPLSDPLKTLKKHDVNAITHAARVIVNWMLNAPVKSVDGPRGLNFKLEPSASHQNQKQDTMTIGTLLHRYPKILHMPTGPVESGPIMQVIDNSGRSSNEEEIGHSDPTKSDRVTAGKVVSWFPILQDALEDIRRRCLCQQCSIPSDVDQCHPGCLRYIALSRFFLLISHAIIDALGGNDVSGRSETSDQITSIPHLFKEIVQSQCLSWDTLFEIAACTLTGLSWRLINDSRDFGEGSESSWAAIQYGSLVAAAGWLDLNKETSPRGAFSIAVLEGAIQGLPDDLGLLRCEPMLLNNNEDYDLEHAASVESDPQTRREAEIELVEDSIVAEVLTAVFHEGSYVYRLMTSIRSGNAIRVVDPSLTVLGDWKAIKPTCQHVHISAQESRTIHEALGLYTFDEALQAWTPRAPSGEIELTHTINYCAKLNVLLSMSNEGACVIRDIHSCCLPCALRACNEQIGPGRFKSLGRVLNVDMEALNNSLSRKRIHSRES